MQRVIRMTAEEITGELVERGLETWLRGAWRRITEMTTNEDGEVALQVRPTPKRPAKPVAASAILAVRIPDRRRG